MHHIDDTEVSEHGEYAVTTLTEPDATTMPPVHQTRRSNTDEKTSGKLKSGVSKKSVSSPLETKTQYRPAYNFRDCSYFSNPSSNRQELPYQNS